MSNFDYSIDKEITEGLARSEKMIRRQRMIKNVVILSLLVVIFLVLCCAGIGLWWLWNYGDVLLDML